MANSPILNIAGQAVIEGVMFRHKDRLSMAVRQPSGKIAIEKKRYLTVLLKSKFFQLPILRGIIVFFETLVLGLKVVSRSAALATEGEEEQLSGWEIAISIVISLLFVLILFKLVPYAGASGLVRWLGGGNILLNLAEGLFKILLFVAYLMLIGLMPDVKRMFMYHGAEHKTINCYEAGKKLTIANIKKATKRQPRCGTTFIIIVFILSIFFYVAIPFGYSFWAKYLLRIMLLPIIAGVGYELIKFAGKYFDKSCIVRAIMTPGMWFQDLTTREPETEQIQVAIAAVKAIPGVKI